MCGDKAEHPTEAGYSATVQRLEVTECWRGSGLGQQWGDWVGGWVWESKSVETHERKSHEELPNDAYGDSK